MAKPPADIPSLDPGTSPVVIEAARDAISTATGSELAADRDIEAAIRALTPEQIEIFIAALEATVRKRRVLMYGYMIALASIVFGMIAALYLYGTHERGTFIGWVFLIPIGCAAVSLIVFGRLAKRASQTTVVRTHHARESDDAPAPDDPAE